MEDESLFRVGETVEYWRVLVHLSILAFCLVLFEKLLRKHEHKFPPSDIYHHILKIVYRELMTLGLISFGLKILEEIPGFISESKSMLAFEVADLAVFLLALALIVQSSIVFLLLCKQNDRAERADLQAVNIFSNNSKTAPSLLQTVFCCGKSTEKSAEKGITEFRLLRSLFLRRYGLPQLFPFSKYLSRAHSTHISHMLEVEPTMWLVLLGVAWGICGLLKLLEELDTAMPERQDLVEAFFMIAWLLLLPHIMVLLYLRSCVHYLLRAAFSDGKSSLIEKEMNLLPNGAEEALQIMTIVQEQHEEFELQLSRARAKQKTRFWAISKVENAYGVVPGSPRIDIRFFSYSVWHASVMLLMVLNGFLIALFVQCVLYDLDEIYEDFGALPTLLVLLPLALNTCVFQPRILYDFVLISSILRIDSQTLSEVVESFTEVIRLRSEFGSIMLEHLAQNDLSIADLQAELETRDAGPGCIEVDDLRYVLAKFGFRLTRFRFNSAVKLLFELEDTTVAYSQVVQLVLMAEKHKCNGCTCSVR